MTIIHTIGYEQAQLKLFLGCLKAAKVKVVVDVRELPLSRRRGFSKSALKMALARQDIGYVHLRDLGDPPSGRAAARAGQKAKFTQIYKRHLKTKKAQAALEQACELARTSKISLMCFERDPSGCHRTMVVDAIFDILTSASVHHLYVPLTTAEIRAHAKANRKDTNSGKSAAPRRSRSRRDGLLRRSH